MRRRRREAGFLGGVSELRGRDNLASTERLGDDDWLMMEGDWLASDEEYCAVSPPAASPATTSTVFPNSTRSHFVCSPLVRQSRPFPLDALPRLAPSPSTPTPATPLQRRVAMQQSPPTPLAYVHSSPSCPPTSSSYPGSSSRGSVRRWRSALGWICGGRIRGGRG